MKERPILFSTPMVQAIMEGRKTMTRRIVKPQPEKSPATNTFVPLKEFLSQLNSQTNKGLKEIHTKGNGAGYSFPLCPYGKVGDVLWVRETWQPSANNVFVHFKADCADDPGKGWKPSIHMKKEYARIWLEIVSVRAERLDDITVNDAINEGIKVVFDEVVKKNQYQDYLNEFPNYNNPINSFRSLWKKINGAESWDANPWVWVVEFKRINK